MPAIEGAQVAAKSAVQPEPTEIGGTPRWRRILHEGRKRQGEKWGVKQRRLLPMIRAEVTRFLIRPFLNVALLVGLLFVGLDSLYVNQGLTFGAHPFADYLSLVLWGLGSDVASRTIANLRGGSVQT